MIVIIMISIIIYLIVALSTYKAMPEIIKQKKYTYIFVGFLIIFLITYILANIYVGTDITQEKEKLNAAKKIAIYLMAPINSFILMPIGNCVSKAKGKRITKDQFERRLLIWVFIFIVCIIFFEQTYIKNFVQGLLVNSV